MTTTEIEANEKELQILKRRLTVAKTPEEVFGETAGVVLAYRKLLKVCYPGCYVAGLPVSLKILAETVFKLLDDWHDKANARISNGTYGQKPTIATPDGSPITIKSSKHTYIVIGVLGAGDLANLYHCTYGSQHGVLKIVRNPADNDLAINEIAVIKAISSHPKALPIYLKYLPVVVDSFMSMTDKKKVQAVVFPKSDRYVSLDEVIRAFPDGLPAVDAAWMFNRLLEGLYFPHSAGYVHGAVLPTNILVGRDDHGGILTEWSFAVKAGTPMKAISHRYMGWYPPEVICKGSVGPWTDIYLAARTMIQLLGGDPLSGKLPIAVPSIICNFLRSCLIGNPLGRPHNVGELREEFGGILSRVFGKRKFRHLVMPEIVSGV